MRNFAAVVLPRLSLLGCAEGGRSAGRREAGLNELGVCGKPLTHTLDQHAANLGGGREESNRNEIPARRIDRVSEPSWRLDTGRANGAVNVDDTGGNARQKSGRKTECQRTPPDSAGFFILWPRASSDGPFRWPRTGLNQRIVIPAGSGMGRRSGGGCWPPPLVLVRLWWPSATPQSPRHKCC